MKTILSNRKSVLFSWLVSYISILLVPIIISGLVYAQSDNVIKGEISRSNSALLKLVQRDIDSHLSDVESMSLKIAFNPKVEQLLSVNQPLQTYERYTISQLIADFSQYNSFKSFVNGFYVYLNASQLILTQSAQYNMKLFYDEIDQYQGISFEDYTRLLKEKHTKEYIPLTIKSVNGQDEPVIAFAQSIPIQVNAKVSGNIMILFDEIQLLNIIQSLRWVDNGTVLILDSKNRVITSNVPVHLPNTIRYEEMNQPGKWLDVDDQGEQVIVSYQPSQVNGWKYVSIIPVNVFMEKVRYVQRLTTIAILLCILIGGIVAYFFIKKNYAPVKDLVQAIGRMVGVSTNKGYNEYRFIREALNSTIADKGEFSQKIKLQNMMLRSNFLLRLLKGKAGNPAIVQDLIKSYDLRFFSETFSVLLFYIEDIQLLYGDNGQENLRLVQFIIGNVVEELAGQMHGGIVLEIDEMMVCLLNFREEARTDPKEDMMKLAREASAFLKERFKISLCISASEVHRSINGIPRAYQEALEAMEYRIFGHEKIIMYKEIQSSPNQYHYPIETEYQLINAIKTGDFHKASGLLNEVFRHNFDNELLPAAIVKCLLFNLIGTMIKAMGEISGVYEDMFIQELDPIKKLLECGTVLEMKEQMMQILKGISDYIAKNRRTNNSGLKTELEEFIEHHYQDANLSITTIADRFRMHPGYLSRLFKEHSGISLFDYINKVRVNKVKQLLKEEQLNIGEAAIRVGYNDARTLIRIFKKYEGITPGQYKKM